MDKKRKIMIVAGEPSGDGHAARLAESLRKVEPETAFEFFGSAGPKMRSAGIDAVVRADDLSVVGVAEIALALPMFLRAYQRLKIAAVERKPEVVVLVDFPDFNLKLAKWLKRRGFRVIYYISPQLWAWRKYRVVAIKKYVDLLLTILPFEKDWYGLHGVKHVKYVGNPLAKEIHATESREQFCLKHSLNPKEPLVALLPGSRQKEIVRILPVMVASAEGMAADRPKIQFVIAIGSSRDRIDAEKAISHSVLSSLKIVVDDTYNALAAADVAAVTSGTATLEAGILGTPMVIVYKTSALNYLLLKPLISVQHYGLINLIAGERVVKELIQGEFSSKTVSEELFRLLDPEVNASVRARLLLARNELGTGGASVRAARAILELIGRA